MTECLEWRIGEPVASIPHEQPIPAMEKPTPLIPSMRLNACIGEGHKRGHVMDRLSAFIQECTSGAHLDDAGQPKQ